MWERSRRAPSSGCHKTDTGVGPRTAVFRPRSSHSQGIGVRTIAQRPGRAPSIVSRELRRNTLDHGRGVHDGDHLVVSVVAVRMQGDLRPVAVLKDTIGLDPLAIVDVEADDA